MYKKSLIFSYAYSILTHTENTCAIPLCLLSIPLNVIQIVRNECYSHSMRLFCNGVPVSTTLRKDLILFIALEMADWSFFRIWPSSHTIMSGPTGNQKYVRKVGQKQTNNYMTCINILKGVPILVKFQGNFQNYAYTVHVDVDLRKKYFLLYKVIKLINIFIEFCL